MIIGENIKDRLAGSLLLNFIIRTGRFFDDICIGNILVDDRLNLY